MDITQALAPKSDQLDAADLIGNPPRVFTITAVSENSAELADQQPVNITLAEFPRVWRPSKGMLRVLADNWTKDTKLWVGRKVELYGDPDVYFGKERTGGTRIKRLSHIDGRKTTRINPRGGRNATWTVEPITDAVIIESLRNEWNSADPERRKAIEAEVAALQPKQSRASKQAEGQVDDVPLPDDVSANDPALDGV